MKYVIAAASIAFSVTVSDGAWAQTLTECGKSDGYTVCRQSISDSWLGNLRECLAHLV
jgi:hypothetical protein